MNKIIFTKEQKKTIIAKFTRAAKEAKTQLKHHEEMHKLSEQLFKNAPKLMNEMMIKDKAFMKMKKEAEDSFVIERKNYEIGELFVKWLIQELK